MPEPPPPSDPELRAELGIPDDVSIHRVDLSGRGDQTRLVPTEIHAATGDLVQFVVLDQRVHLLRFDTAGLSPEALAFLRSTEQDAPPPLLEQGVRLVLSFDGAPAGIYPFRVEGSGPPVRGRIVLSGGEP